jgi:hypothetical protein
MIKNSFILVLCVTMFYSCVEVVTENAPTPETEKVDELAMVKQEVDDVVLPTLSDLRALKLDLSNSHQYIQNWVNQQSRSDNPDKEKLRVIMNRQVPSLLENLDRYSSNWSENKAGSYKKLKTEIDSLFTIYREVQDMYHSFESYDDPTIVFVGRELIHPSGEIDTQINKVKFLLDDLILVFTNEFQKLNNQMNRIIREMQK